MGWRVWDPSDGVYPDNQLPLVILMRRVWRYRPDGKRRLKWGFLSVCNEGDRYITSSTLGIYTPFDCYSPRFFDSLYLVNSPSQTLTLHLLSISFPQVFLSLATCPPPHLTAPTQTPTPPQRLVGPAPPKSRGSWSCCPGRTATNRRYRHHHQPAPPPSQPTSASSPTAH